MKKILYGAALLALAAGCAENELDSLSTQQDKNKIEGVAFKAELEEPATRAEWEKTGTTWNMFWYAERDKMDFYVKNASIGHPNTPLASRENIEQWNVEKKAIYKASRTLGEGYFVADDNNKVINFTRGMTKAGIEYWNKPSFRYVWPTKLTPTLNRDNQLSVTLPELNGQEQTDMNGASTIKYAFMSGKLDNVEVPADSASGADVLIGMKLTRKFPLAVYSVKNYDDNKDLFGKLKSITLTSNGQTKADGKPDSEKKENIDYGSNAMWNLETDVLTIDEGTDASEMKLSIGNKGAGMVWKDGATAFMTINSVNRSGNTLKSNYSVTYEFENVTITDNFDTKANWLGGQVIRMSGTTAEPDFDLRSQPYTLIKNKKENESDADTYTLMINPSFKGKVAEIIKNDKVQDSYDNIPKEGGVDPKEGGVDPKEEGVELDAVTKLIVAPDVEDPTTFAKFKNLTEVTLDEEKELVEGMFCAEKLTALKATKVTKVAELFNKDAAGKAVTPKYVTLKMPAYEFNESKIINGNFFNDNTKTSLKTLDISGVKDMAVPFEDITLAFVGYALETVTVKDGVNVSQNAFKDCTGLKYFTGKVNLTTFDATNAFSKTKIESISVEGRKIPANAFNGCTALTSVTFDASELKGIEAGAFLGCSLLNYMDLSGVETLGEYAFKNSGLTAPDENTKVLIVGAGKLPTHVFYGTKVTLVRFKNATEVGSGIFESCTQLSQVRFDKAFTYPANAKIGFATFGTSGNVTLYVDKANQKYVSGSILQIPRTYDTKGNVTEWGSISFKGIYDNAYWNK